MSNRFNSCSEKLSRLIIISSDPLLEIRRWVESFALEEWSIREWLIVDESTADMIFMIVTMTEKKLVQGQSDAHLWINEMKQRLPTHTDVGHNHSI